MDCEGSACCAKIPRLAGRVISYVTYVRDDISQFVWVGSVHHQTMYVNRGIGSSWPLCVLSRDNQGEELPVKGAVGTLFMSHRSLLQRTPLR